MGLRPKGYAMRNNNFIVPSDEEDACINTGIALDEDNPELTDEQFAQLRPFTEALPDMATTLKRP